MKQEQCWEKLRDKKTQFILFGGGAGGGKSWVGCEWLVLSCIAYPGTKWFVGRNELKRIMRSTFITFKKVCKWHNIPDDCWKLNGQYNFIEFWNGSRIDLLDVAYKPTDPLYERFGSEEYTGGWLEEVGEINGKAYDVLKSRIGRHMNKETGLYPKILLTCNPKKNWIYFEFYNPWKAGELPDDSCFIQSLYGDNPYTADTYGMSLSKLKDKVMKQRLMEGNWEYEEDSMALMTYPNIIAIFEREMRDDDKEFYLSVDVARFGGDKEVIILWQGYHIRKIWYYLKSSTVFTEDKINSICDKWKISRDHVVVDQDSVGGGVVDHLPGVYAFVNGGSAIQEWDDDSKWRTQDSLRFAYKNLRSQCYARLAEYVNEGIVSCSKDIDKEVRDWMIEELEAIRKKEHENADDEHKFQIIAKDEIKALIGRSPDFSDAMMMRCVFDLGEQRKTIADDGEYDIEVVW